MNIMAEEIDLDVLDDDINRNNAIEERIKSLSGKVKSTAEERDAERARAEEAHAKLATAEKEIAFFSSFSDSLSKYPTASEYKDAIKEKVLSGYSVEDATVAVLAREGKLQGTQQTQTYTPPPSPAGGSATNIPMGTGNKSLKEMSHSEKFQALKDAEARGDISMG